MWHAEQGESSPPDHHLQNHHELLQLVTHLLEGAEYVELYGCWSGAERHPTEDDEQIEPSRLVEERFWFRERVLYRILTPKPGGC